MTNGCTTYCGGLIFDGYRLLHQAMLTIKDGLVVALDSDSKPLQGHTVDLQGDILCPGFVDLQVNGGGGVLFNHAPSLGGLHQIAAAHRGLGSAAILPTLITDTPETTTAAIKAVEDAIASGVDGVVGLHLEGPHLSVARRGAHNDALVRNMTDDDLRELTRAAERLPVLFLTVAPESVSTVQVSELVAAGAIVSLGHTDADYKTCMQYVQAGASFVTHLFNAMRQLGSREPGLVGAALSDAALSAGVIADGVHVHPASLRLAWQAKRKPGKLFLVSDAMACAGSDISNFTLGDRTVNRADGRLTLEDGTLAGADLDFPRAIGTLVNDVGIALPEALAAATSAPARLIGLDAGYGQFVPGEAVLGIRLGPDFRFKAWL